MILEFLKSIVLGIVQGLTEFLPVSSSGHLVLLGDILNFKDSSLTYDIFLHFGTFIVTLYFFRKKVWYCLEGLFRWIKEFFKKSSEKTAEKNEGFNICILIIISIIPAGIIGVLFKDVVGNYFRNSFRVYLMLGITGVFMLIADKLLRVERNFPLNWKIALFIGLGQAFAVIPGISRSGTTLLCALICGINKKEGAEFSFLISLPVIGGAALLEILKLSSKGNADFSWNYIAGALSAMISGYFALKFLMYLLGKSKLKGFGFYCLLISVCGMIFLGVK